MSQYTTIRRPVPHLYLQVLAGIVIGALIGTLWPSVGAAMKPLGDGFVKLIKMAIAPIIFCTIVSGIAKMRDMRSVGRIGLKALVYFEVVSTIALVIGLVFATVLHPGSGVHADLAALDTKAIASYTAGAQHLGAVDFVMNVIPTTAADAFVKGDILQVLLLALLFGVALLRFGAAGHVVIELIDQLSHVLFAVIRLIMRLAPIGACGAMAFTVATFGATTLLALAKLMAGVYLTCFVFVFGVLGLVARLSGFSLWRFVRYLKEEILIVLGTSSSEAALPPLMAKLEALGCQRQVVGLVVPTGYSFNLDGTSIYMTMAALFIAQATDAHLSMSQQLGILAVLMLTSKGSAAVTGGGFVTLAATLAVFPSIPVAGLALLLGVDRFMSEARAITNLIGNAVATVAIARWEHMLDVAQMRSVLDGTLVATTGEPSPLPADLTSIV